MISLLSIDPGGVVVATPSGVVGKFPRSFTLYILTYPYEILSHIRAMPAKFSTQQAQSGDQAHAPALNGLAHP